MAVLAPKRENVCVTIRVTRPTRSATQTLFQEPSTGTGLIATATAWVNTSEMLSDISNLSPSPDDARLGLAGR
jgi:hypothetical protein